MRWNPLELRLKYTLCTDEILSFENNLMMLDKNEGTYINNNKKTIIIIIINHK